MVTHPIGLSPSLSSGAHPLPYPSCSPTFRWLAVSRLSPVPCLMGSAPVALLSQIQFRGAWLELPALATNKD